MDRGLVRKRFFVGFFAFLLFVVFVVFGSMSGMESSAWFTAACEVDPLPHTRKSNTEWMGLIFIHTIRTRAIRDFFHGHEGLAVCKQHVVVDEVVHDEEQKVRMVLAP